MEFVSGKTVADRKSLITGKYQEEDLKAAVSAVRQLIELRVPAGTPPGPIGGGTIGHDFFVEYRSAVKYPKVEYLHRQIKRVRSPLTSTAWYLMTLLHICQVSQMSGHYKCPIRQGSPRRLGFVSIRLERCQLSS